MINIQWRDDVNCNFFDGKFGYKSNAITTEYMSGRKVAWLQNSKFIQTLSASLALENTIANPEYQRFIHWYTTELCGPVNTFTCPALSGRWRMNSVSEDAGQRIKTLTIEIEQVF